MRRPGSERLADPQIEVAQPRIAVRAVIERGLRHIERRHLVEDVVDAETHRHLLRQAVADVHIMIHLAGDLCRSLRGHDAAIQRQVIAAEITRLPAKAEPVLRPLQRPAASEAQRTGCTGAGRETGRDDACVILCGRVGERLDHQLVDIGRTTDGRQLTAEQVRVVVEREVIGRGDQRRQVDQRYVQRGDRPDGKAPRCRAARDAVGVGCDELVELRLHGTEKQ
jgi:acetolactate synthase small subunit